MSKGFIGVVAMSNNYVIGQNNRIPWHNVTDLKWFKTLTTDGVLCMGRKTYESIGNPLPHREINVISRNPDYKVPPGVNVIESINVLKPNDDIREYFVCGGGQIYDETIHYCSDFFVTRVKTTVHGNGVTYFRTRYFEEYFKYARCIYNDSHITIEHYRNINKISELSTRVQKAIETFDKSIRILYKTK